MMLADVIPPGNLQGPNGCKASLLGISVLDLYFRLSLSLSTLTYLLNREQGF